MVGSIGDACAHAIALSLQPVVLCSAHECAPYPMGKLSISYTNHCEIMYPKMFRNFVIEYYLHLSQNVVNILLLSILIEITLFSLKAINSMT